MIHSRVGVRVLIPANDQEAILGNGGHVEIPFDILGVGDFFGRSGPLQEMGMGTAHVWTLCLHM